MTVFAARPGLVIGRRGVEVERLKNDLAELTGHDVEISIEEVRDAQLDPQLVAEDVAQQLERRTSFRRAIRRSAEMTMASGADGVKIQVSGRLGGSEMARREKIILGGLPLQTLRSKIQYGLRRGVHQVRQHRREGMGKPRHAGARRENRRPGGAAKCP